MLYNMKVITWLQDNREWVFSGIGIFVIGLIRVLFKRGRSTDDTSTQNSFVNQSPSITQSPVVNINVAPNEAQIAPVIPPRSSRQAPLFALPPLETVRNVAHISGLPEDITAKVCIARFKMDGVLPAQIQNRFEASINFIEKRNASGLPFDSRAGRVNRAHWLRNNDGIQELILVIEADSALFVAKALDHSEAPGRQNLIELDLINSRLIAKVTLTDLNDGKRWHIEYAITYDPNIRSLHVWQTQGLH